ncbi:MAG: radical SAM protein [Bacteroidales bacterium]|nr:radical SAM protein [Bacteroidales bacterium]MCF8386750.1 radical SAM protein [Bacteroidales bacterium]MCF8398981.1 radical SAM protein [Bacteroidales bacterium]
MYKYLFGPVPSRRLGMSLGVDLVPKKVCSLNCIYCEVGPTTKLTTERMEYIPYDKVVAELKDYFSNNPDPDYITFSGYGEPTLNSRIGDILKFIKKNKPGIPVAVLTNGTLLYDEELRQELMDADVILPNLDAVSDLAFKKVNRPDRKLKADKIIEGLIGFRKEFDGEIWLEVFIVPGFNDDEKELNAMKKVFQEIQPDRIQLNTLDRPGSREDLRAASYQELKKIMDLWSLDNVEIIAAASKRKDIQSYRKDSESAILETIARRPCTLEDLADILGLHVNEINKYLDVLESEDKIESVRQERGLFYRIPAEK